MLRTKCIFEPVSGDDGIRVSVMSRHKMNDGRTNDPRIVPIVSYNIHWQELAPLPDLVRRHYSKGADRIDWKGFAEEYRSYLRQPEQSDSLRSLAELAMRTDVTIMCVEPKGQDCHRLILAEMCRERFPALEIMNV